ncbi:MAG: DUF3152 domain-containing protein [Actinophytocola sp.]|nr:DUF3152 domain-containing protein [Actinophytocola sp.]
MDRLSDRARGERPRSRAPRRTAEPDVFADEPAGAAPRRPRDVRRLPIPAPPAEDRYRPGGRRTGGEPLEASWRPDATPPPSSGGSHALSRKPKSKLSKVLGNYGWRAYALPVLLALTLIVVFDSSKDDREGGTSSLPAGSSNTATSDADLARDDPVATEKPVEPADLEIPTAKLPKGGKFTKEGEGTWHMVPGSGKRVGDSGELYKYTVEVEDGIDPSSYGGDDAFGTMVEATLSDPRGWTSDGTVSLQRVDDADAADFRISLTSPETNHRPDVCGFTIKYESSCYRRSNNRVVINLSRWVRGAKAFNADLGSYRQYAINHEVGHALGNGHIGCPRDDRLAPVMMQQTFGVANDYVAKLNQADPSNYAAVPKDGKVCKPNAWPNPQAR